MRTIVTFLIAASLAGALSDYSRCDEKKTSEKEDPKLTAAWKELEGRWKKMGVAQGTSYGDVSNLEIVFLITRQSVTSYRHGKLVEDDSFVRYEIDPNQKPAHVDRILKTKNGIISTTKGVYRIEDDTLRIVFNRTSKDRPQSTDLNINDKFSPYYIEYKRVKEEKEKK